MKPQTPWLTVPRAGFAAWLLLAMGLWMAWLLAHGWFGHALAVEKASPELALQTMSRVGLLSLAWLGCWVMLDWLHGGASRWHVHALLVACALWADTLLAGICLPLAWFAMGWAWHTWVADAARMTLLLATVVAHLVVLGRPWFSGRVAVAGAVVLAVALALLRVHHQATQAMALDRLPYDAQVWPGAWMARDGAPTHEAVDRLWSSPWASAGAAQ